MYLARAWMGCKHVFGGVTHSTEYSHLGEYLMEGLIGRNIRFKVEPDLAEAVHDLHVVLPTGLKAAAIRVQEGRLVPLLAVVQVAAVRL